MELREPVVLMKKGEVQVAETMRTRVPMQETGTEQFVVARSLL